MNRRPISIATYPSDPMPMNGLRTVSPGLLHNCTPLRMTSNCKGQMRDLFTYYQAWDRCGILYGGLVELVVNAMVDVREGFLEWDFH